MTHIPPSFSPAPRSRSALIQGQSPQVKGWLAVLCSALFFYLATSTIRWAEDYVELETAFFSFSRFLLGFVIVCMTMAWKKQRLHPVRWDYLMGRAVFNTGAVFCFYKAVDVSSVAEANILNMTYPLFIVILSWIFLKKQRDPMAAGAVLLACIGIWLILAPGALGSGGSSGSDINTIQSIMGINLYNSWGLMSGFLGGIAIMILNMSRRYHDSQTILFFMFGLGAVITFVLFRRSIHWPSGAELAFLTLCSVFGVLGQYLLTFGSLYMSAMESSVLSSSRILIAALLGPFVVGDPPLTVIGAIGAIMIFLANSTLATRTAKQTKSSQKVM